MERFSVLSWNIMSRTKDRRPFHARIQEFLKKAQADIVCLQEAHESLREEFVAQHPQYTFTHTNGYNLLLSRYPIVRTGKFSPIHPLDKLRNIVGDSDSAQVLWSDIGIGKKFVRIYNCHLKLIGAGIRDRLRTSKQVFRHARQHSGPIIICGDMNTSIPPRGIARRIIQWFHKITDRSLHIRGRKYYHDERFVFLEQVQKHGFRDILDIMKPTWAIPYTSFELFRLKLDWILQKRLQHIRVETGPYISDHRPIFAEWQLH